MNSQIIKTTQSLTTAEEMRNQTKLVMQPYANWEQYLTPAPLSIAILGELVYISSETDFSINKNPPKDGYKYIKYPDSFRACLMQVCNSGWWAFNEAHKNMDQIRLHTMAVPDYMKTAVKILFQDNDEIVKAHLPDQLDNIHFIAKDCLELAEKTEERFTDVIKIIQELLEACINAKHVYGEELDEIKKKLEETKMREQAAQQANERMQKAVRAMEKELKEAQQNYSKAMDSLPSGWETIAMNFVEGMAEGITTLLNGVATVAIKKYEKRIENQAKDSGADIVDVIHIYSKSAEILKCAENILQYVPQNQIDWNKLYDQKNKATQTNFEEKQFQRIIGNLEPFAECDPKKLALDLCEEGLNICKELATYAPTPGECKKAKTKELIKKIRKLTESARSFDCKSKNATNSPSLTQTPPMMSNAENHSQKQRASDIAMENGRFRIEQSRAQLNNTRELHEKSVENMEKTQKELNEILITMRNCEVKEIDFNTTIKMLVKGMDAMGRVKEQWEKMVRFFQMVANIVSMKLSKPLTDFASTLEKTQSLSYNSKLFSKDLLYKQAFQATNIANLVHMISATYTEVSDKYLVDRVSSLGKLMNKAEFERKTDSRLEKIDKELLAILPSAAPEEVKSIQAAVKMGFSEKSIDDYC
ncbi:hypothetical protein AOLI_G00318830 [Acnodon oligacanthus]